MGDSMPNLFRGSRDVVHISANDFVEMPQSKQMRFYHPRQHQTDQGAVVLVYAPWCPHCRDPNWTNQYELLASYLAPRGAHAYAMNATVPQNSRWVEKVGIRGFPTVLMANEKGELAEYEGERDLKPLMESFANFLTQTNQKKKKESATKKKEAPKKKKSSTQKRKKETRGRKKKTKA